MPRPMLTRLLAACSLAAGLAITAPALVSTDAQATVMVGYTLDQRIDAAEYIVRGTVVDTWTEQDANGLVWTRVQLEVSHVFKGPQVDTLLLSEAGGAYGSVQTQVAGAASFSVGEDLIAFASTRGDNRVQLIGMRLGKYTVRLDPVSRLNVVQRWSPPVGQPFDHRFIPPPTDDRRVLLDDFEGQIQARLNLGWDGKPIPGIPTDRLRRTNKLQAGVK